MTIGISVIICLLMLILISVSEVWCKLKDIQMTLSWLIKEIGLYEEKDEETEA